MAEPDYEEDIFADLYDDTDAPAAAAEPAAAASHKQPEPEPEPQPVPAQQEAAAPEAEPVGSVQESGSGEAGDGNGYARQDGMQGVESNEAAEDYDRPIGMKEDGKMFIGGLNWETTDQSLKDYFSQFGEVTECTVMRDGATGRSRGFGFLTFKDPKTVNIVMVKEHALDGKLIDPKRAIPREEQERTAKIFVGGVSQECTEQEFKEFFVAFGRVIDATLMMDKDTGRPRGFGFVTFDSEAAVDRTLEQPLAIHGKMIEVKRAQPRGNLRDDDGGPPGKFGRQSNKPGFNNFTPQNTMGAMDNGQGGGPNNMTPAMMAQYWQRMQQYFMMMQQQMAMQNTQGTMQQMMARQGMNPQMMQQMAAGMNGNNNNNSNGGGAAVGNGPNFNAQEQMMFEQQKYERQQMARMQQGNFQAGNTWDGMYDDVPAPAHMRGGFNGGRGGRGGSGGGGSAGGRSPAPNAGAGNAPANAPTGPKNAGLPGANYRGGGRGGRRSFHPYARGGGG